VLLPKIYNGRNRTFYMVNYERYKEDSPQPLVLSVPTVEMRNGDFSQLKDKAGRPYIIYDPATGANNQAGVLTGSPFPAISSRPTESTPLRAKS
jgi:hypothetical protein